MRQFVPLIRDLRELVLSLGTKRSCEHPAGGHPPTSQEKRPQNEVYVAGTFTLDFPDSRTVTNKFLIFKPPQSAVYGSSSPR